MKIALIITIIIIVIFFSFQLYYSMSVNKTETQSYKIIREEEAFEVRYYPSTTMAKITSSAKKFKELGNTGFGTLAKYIFGGNNEKKQIAMTSPVHMDIGDSISTMAFVMPSKYDKNNLPKPDNENITIESSEPEYVAVIKFGGFATTNEINKRIEMLKKVLTEKGIMYHGNFRYLGYNPPFQIFGRRNEIIVSINENELN